MAKCPKCKRNIRVHELCYLTVLTPLGYWFDMKSIYNCDCLSRLKIIPISTLRGWLVLFALLFVEFVAFGFFAPHSKSDNHLIYIFILFALVFLTIVCGAHIILYCSKFKVCDES